MVHDAFVVDLFLLLALNDSLTNNKETCLVPLEGTAKWSDLAGMPSASVSRC